MRASVSIMPPLLVFVLGGPWSKAFEQCRKVGKQPSLVLDSRQGSSGAGDEEERYPISRLRLPQVRLDFLCDIDDLSFPLGLQRQRSGLDYHAMVSGGGRN